MKSEKWRDCIVSYLDVTNTKDRIKQGGTKATDSMRALHRLVKTSEFPEHECAYCWNDSVLLLALWDKQRLSALSILKELLELKQKVDASVDKSYVVCVKGQVFSEGAVEEKSGKCTILKTWSFAMANCLAVEAEVKEKPKFRANWYLDSWITKQLGNLRQKRFPMKMLPRSKRHVFRLSDRDIQNLVNPVLTLT